MHFYELAGEQPVLVEFLVSDEQADRLLALASAELPVFYARLSAEFGQVAPS